MNLFRLALRFGLAVVRHVADRATKLEGKALQARYAVCDSCDRLDGTTCTACGCNVLLKATWRSEDCPEKKWPPAGEVPPDLGIKERERERGCEGCPDKPVTPVPAPPVVGPESPAGPGTR